MKNSTAVPSGALEKRLDKDMREIAYNLFSRAMSSRAIERARGRMEPAGSCATWTSEARPKAENGAVRVKRRLTDFIGRHSARCFVQCQAALCPPWHDVASCVGSCPPTSAPARRPGRCQAASDVRSAPSIFLLSSLMPVSRRGDFVLL
jgi:hypothetical protein